MNCDNVIDQKERMKLEKREKWENGKIRKMGK